MLSEMLSLLTLEGAEDTNSLGAWVQRAEGIVVPWEQCRKAGWWAGKSRVA